MFILMLRPGFRLCGYTTYMAVGPPTLVPVSPSPAGFPDCFRFCTHALKLHAIVDFNLMAALLKFNLLALRLGFNLARRLFHVWFCEATQCTAKDTRQKSIDVVKTSIKRIFVSLVP